MFALAVATALVAYGLVPTAIPNTPTWVYRYEHYPDVCDLSTLQVLDIFPGDDSACVVRDFDPTIFKFSGCPAPGPTVNVYGDAACTSFLFGPFPLGENSCTTTNPSNNAHPRRQTWHCAARVAQDALVDPHSDSGASTFDSAFAYYNAPGCTGPPSGYRLFIADRCVSTASPDVPSTGTSLKLGADGTYKTWNNLDCAGAADTSQAYNYQCVSTSTGSIQVMPWTCPDAPQCEPITGNRRRLAHDRKAVRRAWTWAWALDWLLSWEPSPRFISCPAGCQPK